MSAKMDTLEQPLHSTWLSVDDVAQLAPSSTELAASAVRHAARHDAPTTTLLMRLFDQLDYGVMLVGPLARLRFANRSALRECGPARCIGVHEGHLQPRHERERPGFMKALAAARTGRRSMLTLHGDDDPVTLAVVPVVETAPGPEAHATLLVFGRRQVCEPLSVEFFAREHDLTTAERAVLRGLCDGVRPAHIARHCGVAESTIRTQIGSIRQKTGASSIGDLVRRVTVLPPIVALLD